MHFHVGMKKKRAVLERKNLGTLLGLGGKVLGTGRRGWMGRKLVLVCFEFPLLQPVISGQ